jgi:hypothetical protein
MLRYGSRKRGRRPLLLPGGPFATTPSGPGPGYVTSPAFSSLSPGPNAHESSWRSSRLLRAFMKGNLGEQVVLKTRGVLLIFPTHSIL